MIPQAQEEQWEERVEELRTELFHVSAANRQNRKELNAANRELAERRSEGWLNRLREVAQSPIRKELDAALDDLAERENALKQV